MVSRGTTQLKVGLRVSDLEASCADRYNHGYHNAQRREAAIAGPLGAGFVLAILTPDLDASYDLWRSEGLPVTLEPEDAYWARIFYGLDPDGYVAREPEGAERA